MKMIRNRTRKPVRIPLPGGRMLHLGPAREGQISDHALTRPALRTLLDDGTIEIVGESAHGPEQGQPGDDSHEATHGFRRTVTGFSKGDKRG